VEASASLAKRLLRTFAGLWFHTIFCLVGSVALTLAVGFIIGAISRQAANDTELIVPILAGALLATLAAPRWLRGSAPWVGILGLAALFIGWQELYRGWSPIWSHQTRRDYVLSQLFGFSPGCGDSECLYLLFFTFPFLCLSAYAVVGTVALAVNRKQDTLRS
jgi:hypothetical protein